MSTPLTFASGLSSSFLSASLACFFADRTSDLEETFAGAGLPGGYKSSNDRETTAFRNAV